MRSLRSMTALLALLVTVGSNLAAYPCGRAPLSGESEAPAAGAHGTHHGSHGSDGIHANHGTANADQDAGSPDAPMGRECGVLMSCGAAPRAGATTLVQAVLSPQLEAAPFSTIAEPSAADRSQDPPPPRRHA